MGKVPRRIYNSCLAILSWCSLAVLLAGAGAIALAGSQGWAMVSSTTYTTDGRMRTDVLEYRVMPTRCFYRLLSQMPIKRVVGPMVNLAPEIVPAVDGFGIPETNFMIEGMVPVTGWPDEVSGCPAIGIGCEKVYRQTTHSSDDPFSAVRCKTWYCWTLWPAIVLLWLAVPAIRKAWSAFILWLPKKIPLPGICRKCGYDLRATPDRCPECGTPVLATETKA